MLNVNSAQALWLLWNICWHSLWVITAAIVTTSLAQVLFRDPQLKKDGFLFDFQKDFSKKTFPVLVVLFFLLRFFAPTFVIVFVLATLLLRSLLWFYEVIRSSLQRTEKELHTTFLAYKPNLKTNSFSHLSWENLASKQVGLFNKIKKSYFGGLLLASLVGLFFSPLLTKLIFYSPNFFPAFFQNTFFGLVLGVIFPFSYLVKLPLGIFLADLGLSFAGIFSFFSAGLLLAWLRSFLDKYSLKQALAFAGYLLLGFVIIALIGQTIFTLLPWQKHLRITALDQEIAFNLDFFLNCLSVLGMIAMLVIARKKEKLDFSNQVNKIMAKIKKPRR